MNDAAPSFAPLGDSAITVRFGDGISTRSSDTVFRAARRLQAARLSCVTDIVPAYSSLAVYYDPLCARYDEVLETIEAVVRVDDDSAIDECAASHRIHIGGNSTPSVISIPVRYDGPDMADVCQHAGVNTAELIALHTGREYRVMVIGFVPGFAYLGELDPRLSVPRRDTPRKRVPRGSVAIADLQTAVYPAATPGGWQLIGTTDLMMFDPRSSAPSILSVGDRVRFTDAGTA